MTIPQRHPRSEVGLAEALHVCTELGVVEGRHSQWLAESLGLAWREPSSSDMMPQAEPELPPKQDTEKKPTQKNDPQYLELLKPVAREPVPFELFFESHIKEIRQAPELKPATFAVREQRPAFEPLFSERWFQGIFTAILSTKLPSREIDFRKLERIAMQGGAFTQLPFKQRASLVKGVHILLDRSESMQPFWRDQTELVTRLRRLLGSALVHASWFEYAPLLPAESRLIWNTPLPRRFREETPILIVTDFGGGQDPLTSRFMEWKPWRPLFQLAGNSRCRIFALIPSAPEFWPTALWRFVDAALLWDRETSPHTASRLCQR